MKLRFQDDLLARIGTSADERRVIIAQMLARDSAEVTAYWLQLAVAVGIATLGLVLASTAVVIAAMLVAPLMGPIIGLAMGLATGGPLLTLRAAARVTVSVVVTVCGSAAVTMLIPYQEMTSELAARTVPTALDLITAGFCALAGVYAAARSRSDTATTAAGTSIGISLVPPLCTAGFCVATGEWSLAGGATLLFLTNMAAIVLVGTISFVALGFNHVRIASLESEHLAKEVGEPVVRGVARVLAGVFAWRWGGWLRFSMPILLLAVIYVPLRRALDEVTWEVRVRGAARELLDDIADQLVSSQVRVERHQVELVLVIMGAPADAVQTREHLEASLRRISGVQPTVVVRAVPDAVAAAALERRTVVASAAPLPPTPSFRERLYEVDDDLRAALTARWPYDGAGEPLSIGVAARADGWRVTVTYVGEPLDATAREILERALADDLEVPIAIEAHALPTKRVAQTDAPEDVLALAVAIERARSLDRVQVCVEEPAAADLVTVVDDPAASSLGPVVDPPSAAMLRALLADADNVTRAPGPSPGVWFALDECGFSPPTPREPGEPPTPAASRAPVIP